MGKAISGTVGGDDKRMGNTASISLFQTRKTETD